MRLRFNSLPVALVLGVYEMDGANTPGVAAVLRDHGLRCVPEAHCYLAHEGARVDLTRERGKKRASSTRRRNSASLEGLF